ncbi:hypothetical protein N9R50_00050 [bacterium]|nr:hypothetical protein [bacterium]MDB9845256.1 hypothetical protein [Acidimicrobiales bacterium]
MPLTAWYTTLPNGDPDPTALADGEAEIDLDMIEEAMESGEAEAPEGSLDEAPAQELEATEPEATELEATELEAIELEATELEAEDSAEPDTTEAASAPVEPDGGSNTTWVAPVLIGAVAVVGAGVFMVRRKPAA